MDSLERRRTFLRAAVAAGVGWVAADLGAIEDALAWAGQEARAGATGAFSALTPAQAAIIDAMTSRILPALDGRPGAHEAGVVYFIDRALSTFNAAQKTPYGKGMADLNRRATRKVKGAQGFAALTPAEQDDVLRDIQKTPFFQAVRFDTIVGAFGQPDWGGNRDHAGWQMLGFAHQPAFQPPFGYYDADVNRRG